MRIENIVRPKKSIARLISTCMEEVRIAECKKSSPARNGSKEVYERPSNVEECIPGYDIFPKSIV